MILARTLGNAFPKVVAMTFVAAVALSGFAATSACAADGAATPSRAIEFNRDVRPILSDKCFACHGFDAKKRKADLRLDMVASATAERKGGTHAIVAGNLGKSAVWERINSADKDAVMPPLESNKVLTPAEKQTLKLWIEQGAKYQKHWSFEPIVKPAVPAANGTIRNPIDSFILARLTQEGLKQAAEADRPTLIRRAAFALTGLPPTAAEADAFAADQTPDAYEKMVDRYLASPHFGEEMARHWLDVARYGDTHGLHLDNERQMWAFRDYVIKSFNDNKPFDVFTVEQLAGDLLPDAGKPQPTQEQLTATGFNRCNVTSSEGGSIDAEYRYRYAVDRTSTVMDAWMGLTGGCAVCHDHKFDPISTKEFYSLYAFFNSAADPAMDGNAILTNPVTKLTTPEQQKKLADFDGQIAAKQKEMDEKTTTIAYTDPATLDPWPAASEQEIVWLDDDFPANTKPAGNPGHPTKWITAADNGQIFSGARALKRVDKALAQDYFEGGASFTIPGNSKFFAYVYLDPKDLPKTIALQFHQGGIWKHRALWGDYDTIPWGSPNSFEKVNMGPLPASGQWVRLEFPAEKIGLKAGDVVDGFAFTQFGGTVYWDKLGVVGVNDPVNDVTKSLLAWRKSQAGKDTAGAAPDLNALIKEGPDKVTKPEDVKRIRDYYVQNICTETKAPLAVLFTEVANLKKQRTDFENTFNSTFIFTDTPSPNQSFVMIRGAYDKPGEKVEPATPAILPPLKKAKPEARATRLDLAQWMIEPEHPLTARVEVNRLWQQFFGMGLVKTSGDFGSQGEPPSHPELLDWLAATFREPAAGSNKAWDVKAMVRLLVTSAAFRQSSVVTPETIAHDPENRLYARAPRFRLDAEQIRDNALYVSGLMNPEMGGKGVRTYQPPNIWEPVGFTGSNTSIYKQDTGPVIYKRSVYMFLKRTAPPPFMSNFDGPSREQICTRRERSDTPLQALQLMNDVQHVEAARALAERMLTEGGATAAERIAFAYRVTLARKPDAEETQIIESELGSHLARYEKDEAAAKKLINQGESKPKPNLKPSDVAAYTMVANMILNLDETLTRN